ncbi:MAG: heme exporter protein CcmD [Candidatus Lokiarchaeota archaeon]|nr:heme exporter protein CcmD [Candidatus Lokiarchaeota archaeon]
MSELMKDLTTMSISYALFWFVILILILYPKLSKRKIQKRINRLNQNKT